MRESMRKQISMALVLSAAIMALSALASAQNFAKITGKVTDDQGNIIVGAQVQMHDPETGRKYTLKTDKKGQFFSIAIAPGTYDMVLSNNGKELTHYDKVPVVPQPNDDPVVIDFDLKKDKGSGGAAANPAPLPTAKNAPKQKELTKEQKEEIDRINKENEKINKENEKIKGLNQLLAQSRAASQAGNFDQAAASLNQATQADPNRDLLWGALGDAYLGGAKQQTDPAAKKEKYAQAAEAYKKAADLANASTDAKSKASLGSYYNNLGEALAHSGQTDAAIAAYNSAIAAEPNNSMYAFNLGASLMNNNKFTEAAAAFDKVIAIDPNKAEAYYWKANALLNGATLKENKTVLLPGTLEAYKKYLEVAPDGPRADEVRSTLAALGSPVETKFSNKKK